MASNQRRIRIEFGDCDPARIVYYPNYFDWFDRSTQELFASAGVPLRELSENTGILIPLVSVRSDFAAPASWGDELEVVSEIARWGKSSFDVSHRLTNADSGTLIAKATETHACVRFDPADPKKVTSVPIPAELKDALTAG